MNVEKKYTCWVWWGNLKEGEYLKYRLKHTNDTKIYIEEKNRVGEHGLD
jgi:hypothetical protein